MIERFQTEDQPGGAPQYASQMHGSVLQQGPGQWPEDRVDEPEPKPAGRRAGHWVGVLFGCAAVGAVIGLSIVGVMKFVNGPVRATEKSDPLEAARESVAPKPELNLLGGRDIELKYPSVFDTVGDQKTVAVLKLESNRLDDDSSYKWRSINTKEYKATNVKLGQGTAVLMTKLDGTEATLFWAWHGKDLNLAITSSDPHDKVSEMMQLVMPTIRWK
jgi:hypothetical protein